jgi:hypothetical protein
MQFVNGLISGWCGIKRWVVRRAFLSSILTLLFITSITINLLKYRRKKYENEDKDGWCACSIWIDGTGFVCSDTFGLNMGT